MRRRATTAEARFDHNVSLGLTGLLIPKSWNAISVLQYVSWYTQALGYSVVGYLPRTDLIGTNLFGFLVVYFLPGMPK